MGTSFSTGTRKVISWSLPPRDGAGRGDRDVRAGRAGQGEQGGEGAEHEQDDSGSSEPFSAA